MARIIGEAGIRLTADSRGLAVQMRGIISVALKEATTGVGGGSTKGIEDDANRTSSKVKQIFSSMFGHARNLATQFNQSVAQGQALLLLATKAGVALAAVSSLATGVVGLVGALTQAAGAAGLLPAALLAVKATALTVQIGMQGVGDSLSALASGDMAAFADSLKALSPEARRVIGSLGQFNNQIKLLKSSTQDDLFKGLQKPLDDLVAKTLPQARALFNGIALSLNGAARESVGFLASVQAQSSIGDLFANIRASVAGLAPAIKPALSAFLDISTVGSSFLPQLTAGITAASTSFGNFIRGAAESGKLESFFQKSLDTLKQFGQVLAQLGGGIAAVFKAADQAGGGFLNGLLTITTAFNQFVSSAAGQSTLVSFFSAMRGIIAQVIPVVITIAQVVGTTLVPILAEVARTVLPVLNTVVQQFGQALQAARPGISGLIQGLASMLEVFGPTITFAVQLAGILGGVLGKVLQTLAPVLAKVANAILTGLIAVMPKLEPLILQVADAVVSLIEAAIPMVPLFFQILTAVLPILPPLLQLAAAILPAVVSLINALLPLITVLAQLFAQLLPPITQVVSVILSILVPVLNLIISVISSVVSFVVPIFVFMANLIADTLTALASIIGSIWNTIKSIFTGAVSAVFSFVSNGFNNIKQAINNVMLGIGQAVSSGISAVIGFFRDLPGQVLSFLGNIASDAVNAGKNIVEGILRGIGSLGSAIKDKLMSMVSGAWDAVTSFFGIFSPSRLARDTFIKVGEGAIVGLERISPKVEDAALELAANAMAAMNPLNGASLSIGGGSVLGSDGAGAAGAVVLNQVNVMQPGVDAHQFATEVGRLSAQRLAAGATSLPVSVGSVQAGMLSPNSLVGVGS